MPYLWKTLCIFMVITINDGLKESHFQGLQEIENVHVSHKMIHRLKRHVSLKNATTPDVILTKIKGDNQLSVLKFRRNRKKALSPMYILDKDSKLVKKERNTNHCTHIYEDIKNSAHAVVDSCKGANHVTMVSEVILDNQMYLILPKDREKADDSILHSLYKVNMTRNFMHDYKVPEPRINKKNILPNVNHRLRRSTERTFVELMMVIDFSLYTFWRGQTTGTETERDIATLDLIQNMYTFLANGVNMRYQSLKTAYGLEIEVELSRINVLTTEKQSEFTQNVDTSNYPRGKVDGEILLSEFEKWINLQKVKNPEIFLNQDHYMLLTAREIVLSGNAGAAGYAYTGEICTEKSMSIVEDKFNFISVVTAAHELGHSLGGIHDRDAGDSNCRDEYGFILSSINSVYTDSRATHPWKFSLCSANSFKSTFQKLKETGNNCLKEDNSRSNLKPTGSPPGQLFPPDKQCKLMFDPDSVMWRQRHLDAWERICTAMACTQLGLTKVTFVIPGDGTTCGNKKWCWDGKCVYSDKAPEADESCLHGDQPGNIISGTSCFGTLFGGQYWKCYQANIEKPCCASCSSGLTKINGCKYGDVSDCSKISSKQCYNDNISGQQCCKTCHDFAQPYVSLPKACKYGDRKSGCDRSDSTCTRLFSDCCSTCNGYTPPNTPTTQKEETPPKTTEGSVTKKKTEETTLTTIEKPVEKTEEGQPSWLLPVAGGAAGVVVLSVLIGVCYYCMKQNPSRKYKGEGSRGYSDGRYRHRSSEDRHEHRRRRHSEDRGRRSEDRRRDSDDRRRRSDDNRRDRRDRRRSSEDSRGGYRHYDRRPSAISGNSRY